MAGDEFLVLNHGLEVGDGGGSLDGIGRRGAGGGGYDDLHCCCLGLRLGCSKPMEEEKRGKGGE